MLSRTFGTRNPRWEGETSLVVDEVNEEPILSEEGKKYLRALMSSSPPPEFQTLTTDSGYAAIEEQRRLQRERETAKPTVSWPASWLTKGGRRKKYTRRYKKLKKQSRTKKRKQNRKGTSKKGTNRKRNSRKTYHR